MTTVSTSTSTSTLTIIAPPVDVSTLPSMTLDELAKYKGKGDKKSIYMAVRGKQ